MKQENEKNKQQIANLDKKIHEMQTHHNELLLSKASNEDEMKEFIVKQEQMTQEIDSLKAELEEVRAEKVALTGQFEELKTSSQATHSEHVTKNKDLESQVQTLKGQISQLEADKGEIAASKETV